MSSHDAANFSSLPEGLVADILSLTTPADVCRISLVSKVFKSAGNSDAVWEAFLPSNYRSLISRSLSPASISSKKALYFQLCDNPILIDGGSMSFSLDKRTGKRCYMLSARKLSMNWGYSPMFSIWTSLPESRFPEVAEFGRFFWLDIRGKIDIGLLSSETLYAAYLVFQRTTEAYGFEDLPVDVAVGLVGMENHENTTTDLGRAMPMRNNDSEVTKDRGDGWLEVELGEFFHRGDDGELEMSIMMKYGGWKKGLIVQGIEIRPKKL